MSNEDIDIARAYHEVTKHSYTSVRSGAYSLDWENRPLPYKIYPQAPAVALPRDLELSRMPTLKALTEPQPTGDKSLSIEGLTRMIFCGGGLTRRRRVDGEDYHFRAAASAGALYPIEIYIAASDVVGLESGLYHFSPADLKLRGLRRGDCRTAIAKASAMRPSINDAAAVLVLSAIFWRSTWKYRARAYRYCFWDAGTMVANLIAAATADDLPIDIVTAFADEEMETLLGVDGEHEAPLCIVALGRAAESKAQGAAVEPLNLDTVPLSNSEVPYDDLIRMHRGSTLGTAEEAARLANVRLEAVPTDASEDFISLAGLDSSAGLGLGETILRRGSTRRFAREPITLSELAAILGASRSHAPSDFPSLTDTYLIVNAVDELASGAYYYSRDRHALFPIKTGDFRAQAGYLCLEQALGADCSVLLCYMADLDRALGALGNRGYRDAHLEAGIHGGEAYLSSYALGRGATGLTFYDDDTTKFFLPHSSGKSPMLMVAVGVPAATASRPD